jgi:hypothetical protein
VRSSVVLFTRRFGFAPCSRVVIGKFSVVITTTHLIAENRPRVVDERRLTYGLGSDVVGRAFVTVRVEELQSHAPGALDLAVVGVA